MNENQRRRVIVLGSTGSIGTNTLEVVENMPDRLEVVGLSACSRWKELAGQVRRFQCPAAALADETHGADLEKDLRDEPVQLYSGAGGICRLVEHVEADVVVGAITGWAGFRPSLEALRKDLTLALANKETLVVGGELVNNLLQQGKGTILPVDSEQSAIFQAMSSGRPEEVGRVIVTASGGAFRDKTREELDDVSPQQALCHPTWEMGPKITIDSATMMNKALEIVETRWLFDIDPDRIDVLIHPQSVVHSLVEFVDGSVIAQLGKPDMKLPIQYALTYPERTEGPAEKLDLAREGSLDLLEPDPERYPALGLGYRVAREGGTSGAVLNAANEVAVDAFLDGRLGFTEIVPLVEEVLNRHEIEKKPDLALLERADRWAREEANRCSTQF